MILFHCPKDTNPSDKAGPEIDYQILKEVMRRRIRGVPVRVRVLHYQRAPPSYRYEEVEDDGKERFPIRLVKWCPSTDLNDAWQVVGAMSRMTTPDPDGEIPAVLFRWGLSRAPLFEADEKEAALTICRLALSVLRRSFNVMPSEECPPTTAAPSASGDQS